MDQSFGIMVIGDEVLSGQRRDTHFEAIGTLIRTKGFEVAWLKIIPDDPSRITNELRRSLADSEHVFCCGGIGMTPDDYTRRCTAAAANVPLVRHSAAVKEIEKQFGDDAYPLRVVMADLPESASLIPNPVNRIPGFSVDHHYFLPGFPAMAHPMAEWVLDNRYTAVTNVLHQRSVRVTGTTETAMLATLQALSDSYPGFKLYSLPHMGDKPCIEIGFRGRDNLDAPFNALLAHLKKDKIKFEITPGSGVSET